MRRAAEPSDRPNGWNPVPDPSDHFSTGIPDLDRLLSGGYRRGSFALVTLDPTVDAADALPLVRPTILNFLHQSRGMIAVLPLRSTPRGFRDGLLPWVTRRVFDSRVRIVDYANEADEAPYVVPISTRRKGPDVEKRAREDMRQMQLAEKAAQGRRRRPFLELNAFETLEAVVGPETAARMLFFGMKRVRAVGNLGVGLMRSDLGVAPTARGLADYEMHLSRSAAGLKLTGIRPAFPAHRLIEDATLGAPYAALGRAE